MDLERSMQPMKHPFTPNFGAVGRMPQVAVQAQ